LLLEISDAARVRLLPAHLKRREFIGGLTVTLLAASDRALSQTPPNLPRVGVLVSASSPHPFAEAFTD
jgi:hypothetical protein